MVELADIVDALDMRCSTKNVLELSKVMGADKDGQISRENFLAFFSKCDNNKSITKAIKQALNELQVEKAKIGHIDAFIVASLKGEVGDLRCFWLADVLDLVFDCRRIVKTAAHQMLSLMFLICLLTARS